MKSRILLIMLSISLSITACNTKIKNAKTATVKIYGNCEMCEEVIEKAGNIKKVTKVDWNKDSKMATITYDSTKTNQDEILKRIALAGYDSDQFLAPDDVYAKLKDCCQYERVAKTEVKEEIIINIDTTSIATVDNEKTENTTKIENTTTTEVKEGHSTHNQVEPIAPVKEVPQLKAVFDNYFILKDALVKTDGSKASANAKILNTAINAVKMEKLGAEEHTVWMKVMKALATDSKNISATKDVSKQRDYFMALSKNMYTLMKASNLEKPVYYQHCPMYNDGNGANWISKENVVKNPYYGSQMLSCGKVVETIK